MAKKQDKVISANITGTISNTSNKQSDDFKQETPTKTLYITPEGTKANKEAIKLLGLTLYSPKDGGDDFLIVKASAKCKAVIDGQPVELLETRIYKEDGSERENFHIDDVIPINITFQPKQGNKNSFTRVSAIKLDSIDQIQVNEWKNPFE